MRTMIAANQTLRIMATTIAVTGLACAANAQGAFHNLSFEEAAPPFTVIDPTYGTVAASTAIPGWTAYLGADQLGAVLYNSTFLGSPIVGLQDPATRSPFPVQ